MANVTLTNITSGYNISKINTNFQSIQTALNADRLQLSDGGNVMSQDLDMNSNDILNVRTTNTQTLILNGTPVVIGTVLTGLGPNSVGTDQLIDSSVTTVKLASGSVTADKLATGAITSSNVNYTANATGAVTRTQQNKNNERLSIKDFGAVGDGITDDTVAVNNCIAACALTGAECFIPSTNASYRLTSPITLGDYKLSIVGEGCGMLGFPSAGRNLGCGSWFYIDHTGVGFITSGTTTYPKFLRGIGTIRNQPIPNGGVYTPNANDYDIYFIGGAGDGYIDDVCLLNPTKGIKVASTRIFINRLRGQPLSEGINMASVSDVSHISDIHFWPFWSMDAGVTNYQLANLKGIILGNADNTQISDYFTIHCNRSISCENNGGSPVKTKLSNFDFDNGGCGFYVDAACTGVTALLTHGYILGISSAPTGCHNIDISGASSKIEISNVGCDLPDSSCISVTGAGSVVSIGTCSIGRWGHGTTTAFGVNSAVGTTVVFSVAPMITGAAAGTGAMFSTNTGLSCPLTSGFVTSSVDASGNLSVTHNAGITPRIVMVTADATSGTYLPMVTAISSTTFTVNAYPVGSATKLVSHGLSFHWHCAY